MRNSSGKLGDGLDVRGVNGYVVAPPSLHSSGNEYRWAVDPRGIQAMVEIRIYGKLRQYLKAKN